MSFKCQLVIPIRNEKYKTKGGRGGGVKQTKKKRLTIIFSSVGEACFVSFFYSSPSHHTDMFCVYFVRAYNALLHLTVSSLFFASSCRVVREHEAPNTFSSSWGSFTTPQLSHRDVQTQGGGGTSKAVP